MITLNGSVELFSNLGTYCIRRGLRPIWRRSLPYPQIAILETMMPVDAGCHGGKSSMAVVLVVEDDVFIREIAEMMIQDWGHETLSASDGDEALLFLRSGQPIDALFTDVYLKHSVLGGCELAQQAIKLRPELRMLYTTGNLITDKMRAMFVEGTQFLSKPYTEHQLQKSFAALFAA